MARLLVLLGALLGLLVAAVPAGAAVPRDFFGVMADGPLLAPGADLDGEARRMGGTRAGTIRMAFYWRDIEPAPGRFDFAETDRAVAAFAAGGLDVMPVLLRAPVWATGGDEDLAAPPRDPSDYARFVAAVARRYGRGGSLWRERPDLRAQPMHRYQIWNEPSLRGYWSGSPWPATYVALLRAARTALRAADRRAEVVLAGFPNRSWKDLARVYRAGGRGLFDTAAVHPFSGRVRDVVRIVALNRRVMRRHRDRRTPIIASELTWTSGAGRTRFRFPFEQSPRGQAARLTQGLRALAARRRSLNLSAVYWYTWLSPDTGRDSWTAYSGLRRVGPDGRAVAKPAYGAFRRVVRRLTR